MILALVILLVLATVLYAMAYRKKDGSHKRAVNIGSKMLIKLLPLLLVAFIVAGMLQVAVPPELIQSWLGEEAGYKGVLLGAIGGALIPGGPYVSFPIIASIFKAGAGIGTAVAFITGWATLGIGQIPFEIAIVGPKFMLVRLSLAVIVPFVAGGLAMLLFG